MRSTAFALVLVTALLAAPAHAQFRDETSARPAGVALYDTPSAAGGLNLGQLFNSQTVQFSHQAEFSTTTGGAGSLGLGIYTTSVQWQPSQKLAGRVDVGVAQNLFSSGALGSAFGQDQSPQIYLRNAELAYRPTANSVLTFSVQQNPFGVQQGGFGMRQGPFGPGNPYGRSGFNASVGSAGADRLFFRNGQ